MRTVIQGAELTVTIKTDRELSTQEIIAAHQLATGNFEALFIKEEEEPRAEVFEPLEKEVPEWVQVEITCPVCDYQGRKNTKFTNVYTKCPECKTALFNQYATGIRGEKDKAGNYFYAQEIIRPKNGELTADEQELLAEMSKENEN